jgi:AraC-like DNA-binding protein
LNSESQGGDESLNSGGRHDSPDHLQPHDVICCSPGLSLHGRVLCYLGFNFGFSRQPRSRLLLPDSVVKLVIALGAPLVLADAVRPQQVLTGNFLVRGVRATAIEVRHSGELRGITVLLSPSAARQMIAVPMHEWTHRAFDSADLLGPAARRLPDQMAEYPDWDAQLAFLDRVLAGRLRSSSPRYPQVDWAWREIRRTVGGIRIGALADAVGWSRRHLERCFMEQVGVTPKQLCEIVRLQEALRYAEAGLSWSQAAAESGFHDQSHFHRTFKTMTGRTPGQFSATRSISAASSELDFVLGQEHALRRQAR